MKIQYGYIPLDVFERVISIIPPRDFMYAVIFSITRYRGIRPAHVSPIKLDDVQPDGRVRILDTKTGVSEIVELPEPAKSRLLLYLQTNLQRFINGYVFVGASSKLDHVTTNTLCKKWHYYYRLAGFKSDFEIDTNKKILNAGRKRWHVRFYDLRSSFGTDIQARYNDLYLTSVMLGHKDMRSTRAYMRRAVLYNEKKILAEVFKHTANAATLE